MTNTMSRGKRSDLIGSPLCLASWGDFAGAKSTRLTGRARLWWKPTSPNAAVAISATTTTTTTSAVADIRATLLLLARCRHTAARLRMSESLHKSSRTCLGCESRFLVCCQLFAYLLSTDMITHDGVLNHLSHPRDMLTCEQPLQTTCECGTV